MTPEPQPSETPEQLAFWAQFDAWKTDSCAIGDDFFMHMIGTWWKNPVDIYPNGLMNYADNVNYQRVKEIRQTNADLLHLKDNIDHAPVITLAENIADLGVFLQPSERVEIW